MKQHIDILRDSTKDKQWHDHPEERPEAVSKRLGIETGSPLSPFDTLERTDKRLVNQLRQISRTTRPMEEATYETNLYGTPNRWTAMSSLVHSRGNGMSITWWLSETGKGGGSA